jgi:hypothetical protein
MESRVKVLGLAVAVALCAALATSAGRGQEEAPSAPSDQRTGSAGNGDSGDVVAGRGAEPVKPEGGSASLQRRANRKSLIANAPIRPAAPSANISAIAPFKRPGTEGGPARNAVGVAMPGGGGQGFGHAAPGSTAPAGIGMRGPSNGVVGTGAPMGTVDGADPRRSEISPHVITSPVTHTSGINGTGINGTTMGHIASGPGYVGGPMKDRSGINGTAMRPRR